MIVRSCSEGAILRRRGAVWDAVLRPTPVPLSGLGGSGPGDVWAVGDKGTALHWDGRAWTAVATGTTAVLAAVWVAAPDEAWAVGDGVLLRWDGKSWQAMAIP